MHRDVSCPWWIVLSSDAGRHTPRGATLSLPEDSSTPGNEQENQGQSTNGSGPNYTFTTTAASSLLFLCSGRGGWRGGRDDRHGGSGLDGDAELSAGGGGGVSLLPAES